MKMVMDKTKAIEIFDRIKQHIGVFKVFKDIIDYEWMYELADGWKRMEFPDFLKIYEIKIEGEKQ